jgi:hypothetical protein
LERPESAAFKAVLYDENREEAVRERFMAECVDEEAWDREELSRLFTLEASMTIQGALYMVIAPQRAYDDHTEFDAAVCQAGLKCFVRKAMDSDQLGIPGIEMGPYILVREFEPGVRTRQPVRSRESGA